MKYCRSCGKEINDNVKFCPFCGQKTGEAPQMSVTQAKTPEPVPTPPPAPVPEPTGKVPPVKTPEPVMQTPPPAAPKAPVQPMPSPAAPKKEKKSGNAAAVILLLVLFVIGLIAEILVNTPIRQLIYNPFNTPRSEVIRTVFRQAVYGFENESIPIYSVLTYVLYWMMVRTRFLIGGLLRWIPYLILFFIPVLSAMVKKKGIPLLIGGVFTLFEGIGVLIAGAASGMGARYFTVMNGIPFIVEAVLVILLAIAFFAKSKPLCIIIGIFSILFAVFSLFLTPSLRLLNAAMQRADMFGRALRMVLSRPGMIFTNSGGSFWPIYKTFVVLMYALLAFLSAGKLKKN
ncbi:MAG: zinc-ribbon domain-containing protein [Lachnospiraceae bacterium]|nr:zinc-ribbon domain-containing protein [Lachnospiraceae bacterium]